MLESCELLRIQASLHWGPAESRTEATRIELGVDRGLHQVGYVMHYTGKLVPSKILVRLIRKAMKNGGWNGTYLLDGFPRNL